VPTVAWYSHMLASFLLILQMTSDEWDVTVHSRHYRAINVNVDQRLICNTISSILLYQEIVVHK